MSGTASCAIDVEAVQHEAWPSFKWTRTRRYGRGERSYYRIQESEAVSLLDSLEYRGYGQGGEGFDDPPHWGAACRKAALNLRTALHPKEGTP